MSKGNVYEPEVIRHDLLAAFQGLENEGKERHARNSQIFNDVAQQNLINTFNAKGLSSNDIYIVIHNVTWFGRLRDSPVGCFRKTIIPRIQRPSSTTS